MKTDYKARYKETADDDLIVIAVLDKALFLPEAVAAAREELLSRGIDPDSQAALDMADRIDKHRNRFKEKSRKIKGAAKAVWVNKVRSRTVVRKTVESEASAETHALPDKERGMNAYQAACVIIRFIGLLDLPLYVRLAYTDVVRWFSGHVVFHEFVGNSILSVFFLGLSTILIFIPGWIARTLLSLNPKAPPMGDIPATPFFVQEVIVLLGCYLTVTGLLNVLDSLTNYLDGAVLFSLWDIFDYRIHNIREATVAGVLSTAGLIMIFNSKLFAKGISMMTPFFSASFNIHASPLERSSLQTNAKADDCQKDY